MSDFARILPAIRHYEGIARAQSNASFSQRAEAQFNDLQRKYYSKTDNPDYSSALNKFCYLFKYAVPHGYFVYDTLRRAKAAVKGNLFPPQGIRIACIGGGPGSEIIGIARYLRQLEPERRTSPIEIVVFDREPSWEEVGKKVLGCLSDSANISLSFVPMDATDARTYQGTDFSRFGIVVSSFFMSETRKLQIATVSRQFWKFLFQSMQSGAWFIAVDFADGQGVGRTYLASVIASAGRPFVDVLSDSALTMSCPDSKAAISNLEAELDHRPKKKATNLVRVVAAG